MIKRRNDGPHHGPMGLQTPFSPSPSVHPTGACHVYGKQAPLPLSEAGFPYVSHTVPARI